MDDDPIPAGHDRPRCPHGAEPGHSARAGEDDPLAAVAQATGRFHAVSRPIRPATEVLPLHRQPGVGGDGPALRRGSTGRRPADQRARPGGARLRAEGQRRLQARRPRVGPVAAPGTRTTAADGLRHDDAATVRAPATATDRPNSTSSTPGCTRAIRSGMFDDWNPTCPAAGTATTAADPRRSPPRSDGVMILHQSQRPATAPSSVDPMTTPPVSAADHRRTGHRPRRRALQRHARSGARTGSKASPPSFWVRFDEEPTPVRVRPVHDDRGLRRRQDRSNGRTRWRPPRTMPARSATSSTSGWSRAGRSPRSCGRCRSARACG